MIQPLPPIQCVTKHNFSLPVLWCTPGLPPHILCCRCGWPQNIRFTNMRFTRQPVLKCWCALSSVLQVCVTSQLCVVVMACPHTMCCSCGWPKKKPFRKHEIYSSASFEIWCAPKLGFTGLCHISILCCTHGLSPTYCVAGVGGPKSILFKNIEVARKPFLQFL
jgi:hypothetical protein